jgi:ubiquinone biosynthesis protein UbiJ
MQEVQTRVEQYLAPLLGDFTARMAVRTATTRAEKQVAALGAGPALLEALRPMLNTFLGQARAKAALDELADKVGR